MKISSTKKYVTSFSELGYYFDINEGSFNSPNNTIIIFPFYCKIRPSLPTKSIGKIRIHKSLISPSIARLQIQKDNHTVSRKAVHLADCIKVSEDQEGIAVLQIPKSDQMNLADRVEIRIVHDTLNEITRYEEVFRNYEPSPQYDYLISEPSPQYDYLISEPSPGFDRLKESSGLAEIKRLLGIPIEKLASEDESAFLEFKSSLRWSVNENKISEYVEFSAIKEIPAFLNSDGGILIIGINPQGEIIGLTGDLTSFNKSPTWDTWQQHFTSLIHDRYKISAEFDRYIHIQKKTHKDKVVAIITIDRSKSPVWMVVDNRDRQGNGQKEKQVFYVRRKNKTVMLEGLEFTRYVEDRYYIINR